MKYVDVAELADAEVLGAFAGKREGSIPSIGTIFWASSSAGQSWRLITAWSRVQVLPGPPKR